MIYTGRQVHAEEALRIGLVNAVHPLDQLISAAREMAAALPGTVRPRCAPPRTSVGSFYRRSGSGTGHRGTSFGTAFAAPDRARA